MLITLTLFFRYFVFVNICLNEVTIHNYSNDYIDIINGSVRRSLLFSGPASELKLDFRRRADVCCYVSLLDLNIFTNVDSDSLSESS